jgi:hypothetical protein
MPTMTAPAPRAGTDADKRLIKNRPLNGRQMKVLRFVAASETAVTPSIVGGSSIYKGEHYATDKARRSLFQLAERGLVNETKAGFKATAKGKKLVAK